MAVISCEMKKQTKSASFDVALAETEFGRYNYFLIVVSGIIIINTVLEITGLGYILPIAECDLNFSETEKSALSCISFVGIICGSYIWGLLADTLGRRKIMIPSLWIAFFITVISSFSINFTMLITLRFLNGVFICGGSATIFAYLSEFHFSKKRHRAIMAASFFSATVAISFPFVAWFIINQDWKFKIEFLGIVYKPWRLYIISCGLYGLLGAICLWKCYESPKFLLCIGKEQESIEILSKIFAINTRKSPKEYSITSLEPEQSAIVNRVESEKHSSKLTLFVSKLIYQQTVPLFSKRLIRSTLVLCFMQFCTYFTAHGMRIWLAEILNSVQIYLQQNANSTNQISVCNIIEERRKLINLQENKSIGSQRIDKLEFGTIEYSVIFELIYPIAFLLVASGMKFVGRVKIIFFILTICGSCSILSAVINIPIIGIFLYLVQLLAGIGVTVINSLTVELFPTHLKTMAVSLAFMFGRFGSVFGSNLFGLLMSGHCKKAFIGAGVMLILSGFLIFFLPRPEKTVLPTRNTEQTEEEKEDDIYITKL